MPNNHDTRTKEKHVVKTTNITLTTKQMVVSKIKDVYEDFEEFYNGYWGVKKHTLLTTETSDVTYDLVEIQPTGLEDLRISKVPAFIYKTDGKFYYTFLHSRKFNYLYFLGEHKCSNERTDCVNLSPLSCTKVYDKVIKLENYPYITKAIQTLNVYDPRVTVLECTNCEFPKEKRMSERAYQRMVAFGTWSIDDS